MHVNHRILGNGMPGDVTHSSCIYSNTRRFPARNLYPMCSWNMLSMRLQYVGVRAAGQVNLSVSSRAQAMQVCYDRSRLLVQ